MKVFNKIVRDKIPEIIEAAGKKSVTHILSDEEYIKALETKLNEEVAEYQEDKNIEEMADVLEVLQAICVARGYTLDQLEEVRAKKAEERGGFKEKIFLEYVEQGCDKMKSKIFPVAERKEYKTVVILSQYKGRILLSRHKARSTWEVQGGHIEAGETPIEAAKRELYEESGAVKFYIAPICDYQVGSDDETSGANGMAFKAIIHELGQMPDCEMAEIKQFDDLPENLTYPEITPALFDYLYRNNSVLTVPIAEMLLQEAAACNPGPWEKHSEYVACAARSIAEECGDMDPEKAYILGLLHDIGRKFGAGHLAHVYNGYHYLKELGFEEAAQVALTHSFNLCKIEDYIGNFDISEEKQAELVTLLADVKWDEYDYLIQLCDSIAKADGIVSMEERMNDVKSRYGYYPQEKWDRNEELMRYFEQKMGKSLYDAVKADK